jgi:hypothetical protein
MPRPLQLGRIVWAEIADASEIRKLRPAVIVTPSDRITPAAPLDGLAVTSRVPEPLPEDKHGASNRQYSKDYAGEEE